MDVWHRDLFEYFRVIERTVTVSFPGIHRLCDENPDRVVLIIAIDGTSGQNIEFTTRPDAVTGAVGWRFAPGGLGIDAMNGTSFILNHSTHGKLCQIPWFMLCNPGVQLVSVIECILDRKPCHAPTKAPK